MKKTFLLVLAIMLVVSLILTGCGKTTSTTTTTATQPAQTTAASSTATQPAKPTTSAPVTTPAATSPSTVKKGGTLHIIYQYSPSTIPGWPGDTTNPQKMWANWVCYEGLVKLFNSEPHPWLATDWTWGPNHTYIDFNLRNDVKFHDGTKFTAESVVTHVNQLLKDKDSATSNWDRIEKTGDYSIRLYLKLYMRDFWTNLGSWEMVFTSDTQLKAQGLDYVKAHPCGTGPFKFASYEKDISMKFVKNENYWQPGKPYLDEIDFETTKEELTQQAKLEAHEGDILILKTGKILQDMKKNGFVVTASTQSSNMIMFDTKNEGQPTNNPKVRQAIEYAINKQEIADAIGYGGMQPNNQIPFLGNPAYNPNLPTREFNPEKAKALLKEAGYPNGFNLTMISENAGQDFAVMFQSYLQAVGINVKLDMVDNAKLWNYLFTGWNGCISTGYGMGTNLPNFLRTYFPPVGTFDVSVKIPDDVLAKINASMVEIDDAKFQAASNEISKWLYDDAFFVPTVGVAMGYIFAPDVRDAEMMTIWDFNFWSPEKTWLDR
jgi:peptide/nickel transport system substrate-binding protein